MPDPSRTKWSGEFSPARKSPTRPYPMGSTDANGKRSRPILELMKIRIGKRTPVEKRSRASIQGKDVDTYRNARLQEAPRSPSGENRASSSHVFIIPAKERGDIGARESGSADPFA